MTKHWLLIVVCVLLAWRDDAYAVADDLIVESNRVYATIEGEDLKLDLVKPSGEYDNAPALVLIHGGGWQAGDKRDFLPFAQQAAKRGYVCATINYRHAPKHRFPAQVEDAKRAVQWLRAHAADFKLNPQRLGAVGGSAGAHLSMMLGVLDPSDGLNGQGDHADQSSKVQAVVSLAGPTNLLSEYPPVSRAIVKTFIGGDKEEMTDTYRLASPITYVNAGDAPMLLFQGTNDVLVPWEQATQMAAALTKAGVSGRVELMLGINHGWGGKDLERAAREALDFLDLHLKPKQ